MSEMYIETNYVYVFIQFNKLIIVSDIISTIESKVHFFVML